MQGVQRASVLLLAVAVLAVACGNPSTESPAPAATATVAATQVQVTGSSTSPDVASTLTPTTVPTPTALASQVPEPTAPSSVTVPSTEDALAEHRESREMAGAATVPTDAPDDELTDEQRRILEGLDNLGPAPELENETWLNSEPLRLSKLRGQVVLLDMWTFG